MEFWTGGAYEPHLQHGRHLQHWPRAHPSEALVCGVMMFRILLGLDSALKTLDLSRNQLKCWVASCTSLNRPTCLSVVSLRKSSPVTSQSPVMWHATAVWQFSKASLGRHVGPQQRPVSLQWHHCCLPLHDLLCFWKAKFSLDDCMIESPCSWTTQYLRSAHTATTPRPCHSIHPSRNAGLC
eukprot:4322594-Amphidinium_carterae.2